MVTYMYNNEMVYFSNLHVFKGYWLSVKPNKHLSWDLQTKCLFTQDMDIKLCNKLKEQS